MFKNLFRKGFVELHEIKQNNPVETYNANLKALANKEKAKSIIPELPKEKFWITE